MCLSFKAMSHTEGLNKAREMDSRVDLQTDTYKDYKNHFFGTDKDSLAIPWSRFDRSFSYAYALGDVHTSVIQRCLVAQDIRDKEVSCWLTSNKADVLTHTSFNGRNFSVPVKDLMLYRNLMAQDLSHGLVVYHNECALNGEFPVFFDVDLHVAEGEEWPLDGETPSWKWLTACVLKTVAIFYPDASPYQLRVVLSRSASYKDSSGMMKTPAHIVCPLLLCNRTHMTSLIPMLHQLLYEDVPHLKWETIIDTNPYRSANPMLRPNGSFKATKCQKCENGTHSFNEVSTCIPISKNKGFVAHVFNNRPYLPYEGGGSINTIDLLDDAAKCYTIRMILNHDGTVNEDLQYARRPGPLSMQMAWLEELLLTSLHVVNSDCAKFRMPAASLMPVPVLSVTAQKQLGVSDPQKLHATHVKQNANWERTAIHIRDPRAVSALEYIRTIGKQTPWADCNLRAMHIDIKHKSASSTVEVSKAFIYVDGKGSNFCRNKLNDKGEPGGHHKSNHIYFVMVHTITKYGVVTCELLQKCFCDCVPSELKRRKHGKCSNFEGVLVQKVPRITTASIFGGEDSRGVKRDRDAKITNLQAQAKRAQLRKVLDQTQATLNQVQANRSQSTFFQS